MWRKSLKREAREPHTLSVFSLVPDLSFDCSRVLEYAKIRTVLQSSRIASSSILFSCLQFLEVLSSLVGSEISTYGFQSTLSVLKQIHVMSSSNRNLNLSSKNSNDRPIIYKQLILPGEREEELLELYTDDAIVYKFTVVHYQYSNG